MTNLRFLGATSALMAAGFIFLTSLDIGLFGQVFAWVVAILLGIHALGVMIRVIKMTTMKAQFLQDPDLGQEAFAEVEEDMAGWVKVQFGKLTRFTFVLTSIFGVAVWFPALMA